MMPKTSLRAELEVKAPGSKSFKKTILKLEWEGRYLHIKKRIKQKINLSETLRWDVLKERTKRVKKTSKPAVERRIISLTMRHKGNNTDWKLAPSNEDFNTWLYWILVSIQKHAKIPLSDDRLKNLSLKDSRKGKLRTRRDLAAFDELHQHFVHAMELYRKGENLGRGRRMGTSGPYMRGDSGRKYTDFKGVGKIGGSGTRLFITKREAIDVVVGKDRDMIFHPPAEPAVVKVASLANLGRQAAGPAKDLVREARILAAIGEHPNIVRITDALAARDGIYMFIEKGDEDLKDRAVRNTLTVQQSLQVALGILEGLGHMHSRRIYHLDMKPENVLLFPGNVPKLIDFGLTICRAFDTKDDAEFNWKGAVGTPGYVPKECWHSAPTKKGQLTEYLEKRDSYATGMTFLDSLIGPLYHMKYTGANKMLEFSAEQKRRWWDDRIKKKLPSVKDPSMMAFISLTLSMIEPDVKRRTSVLEALDLFKAAHKDLIKLRRKTKIEMSRQALKTFQRIQKASGGDASIMKALIKYNE